MAAKKINLALFLCLLGVALCSSQLAALSIAHSADPWQEPHTNSASTKFIGSVKAISGNSVTLTPDSGPEVSVTVDTAARIVRIAPGETSLKNATPIQLQDLQVGDRILVGGKSSEDGKSFSASSIVVMKRSDVQAKQEQERQDWQKRGLGGLVTAVDPSTGAVTISITGFGGTKAIAIHISKATGIRRYAPDSVKFDDAKPGNFQEIKPGDQLRARGNRSADGSELAAEEIVTGSFRNIAGIVNSVDASSGIVGVQDLLSKKTVQIKVSSDSQLHKLPPEMAQRIAMRLKASAFGLGSGVSGAAAGKSSATPPAAGQQSADQATRAAAASPTANMGGGMQARGAPDFNQMLNRMPAFALTDLHKGDAVLIVATQGSTNSISTAITLLSGVEPILQAAPNAGQAMMLAPWNLGGPSGDAGSQ